MFMQMDPEGTLHKDPVCGMHVKTDTAAGTSEYKGVTYYFCGMGCKRAFDKDPEKFLAPDYKPHM